MVTKSKKAVKMDQEFDYKTIKTFEDACKKLGLDPERLPELSNIPDEFKKPILAAFKLIIVYKAINNGWIPEWGNFNQWKYYPRYRVLSSGFGFSFTIYNCDGTNTTVGSHLCTDDSDKALYIAKQFKDLYKDYFLYSK